MLAFLMEIFLLIHFFLSYLAFLHSKILATLIRSVFLPFQATCRRRLCICFACVRADVVVAVCCCLHFALLRPFVRVTIFTKIATKRTVNGMRSVFDDADVHTMYVCMYRHLQNWMYLFTHECLHAYFSRLKFFSSIY